MFSAQKKRPVRIIRMNDVLTQGEQDGIKCTIRQDSCLG